MVGRSKGNDYFTLFTCLSTADNNMVWHHWFIEELKNEIHQLRIGKGREKS